MKELTNYNGTYIQEGDVFLMKGQSLIHGHVTLGIQYNKNDDIKVDGKSIMINLLPE